MDGDGFEDLARGGRRGIWTKEKMVAVVKEKYVQN